MTMQQYLLNLLAEECAEVAIRCSKANRFGLDEVQPGQPLNNAERIIYELNDIYAVVDFMKQEGLIDLTDVNSTMIADKQAKIAKYMKLSVSQGMLKSV